MKTNIYKDYDEFLLRENKKENGVTKEFAENNPTYQEMNDNNEGCFNCNDCNYCRYCNDCIYCHSCSYCSSCHSCHSCSYCSSCHSCHSCSYCSYCIYCSDKNGGLVIPEIKNIHQKILEAVSNPKALDMRTWHTCDTTHCRAGWAVTLAGEAGKELESKTSSLFAGMVIFNKSSDIKVPLHKFFDNNKDAMEDIKRCAELEKSKL